MSPFLLTLLLLATPAGKPALTPPQLIESAPVDYPDAARAERLEGTVLLQLTLDKTGQVQSAEVVQSAGPILDEAAKRAVLQFRFKPATRNGQPIPSRVRAPIEFQPPPESGPPTPETAPVPETEPATESDPELEGVTRVSVQGTRKSARKLRESGEAVTVLETTKARVQTADLGEVIARTQGVSVQRSGGLGSSEEFALNGLMGKQVRFFLDGVPLEFSGYPFGLSSIPVNLIDQVEIYKGVVPIRFGADALGGAINLTTDPDYETKVGASYQIGSFGTHRATLNGRYRDDPSGFVAGGSLFFDRSLNDYPIQVIDSDALGKVHVVTTDRSHDKYLGYGGMAEVGVVDRPWADRLLLQLFGGTYEKQLQNDPSMSTPYGEVHYGETVYGATARYESALHPDIDLELIANYSHRSTLFVDRSEWKYDWFGNREERRPTPGEITYPGAGSRATDQTIWLDAGFGRALLTWRTAETQSLRLSLTPTLTRHWGESRLLSGPTATDPLAAPQSLFTLVGGAEYRANLWDDRLDAIGFVKGYLYSAQAYDVSVTGVRLDRSAQFQSPGMGGSLRYRLTPWIYAKASYEYATRLPAPNELFGDGVLVLPNPSLRPEVSHNVNFGPSLALRRTGLGDFTYDLNGFLRLSDQLIAQLPYALLLRNQNIYSARSLGLENGASWTAPGGWMSLEGSLTWQDLRNTSGEGDFARRKGDRIPNRPYLFGSWATRLRLPWHLEPFYIGRYVHSYFIAWESDGLRDSKKIVGSQLTHDLGLSWNTGDDRGRLTATFEVDNLTDERVFDTYGVQLPGRAFYLKLTGTYL